MDLTSLYEGDYVDGTYGDAEGLRKHFQKIINFPRDKSDNMGRATRIDEFATKAIKENSTRRLLDVGAGLGVFPYAMKQLGWDCLALDPDFRAVDHIRETVGVESVHGDFLLADFSEHSDFTAVTFNKVLEHVIEPIGMLLKARDLIAPDGFIYVEVPDMAAADDGKEREEFTIDHHHVFSPASLSMMCARAGLEVMELERLKEPSGKFTLRVFCSKKLVGHDQKTA